jgi:hypothetical protein
MAASQIASQADAPPQPGSVVEEVVAVPVDVVAVPVPVLVVAVPVPVPEPVDVPGSLVSSSPHPVKPPQATATNAIPAANICHRTPPG